jgi:butyryl-CoA dehydrogenase
MHTRWQVSEDPAGWQTSEDSYVSLLLQSVSKFCREELHPIRKQLERESRFPHEVVGRMSELGLFGLPIPEEYGGFGWSTVAASYVAREISYASGATYLLLTVGAHLSAYPIMLAGNDDQKRRILPRLALGEIFGCYMLTEENGGSDPANMSTCAERMEDGQWKVNGTKIYITGAGGADFGILIALTGKGRFSAFLVETGPGLEYPGITVTQMHKRVQKSAPFYEVHFKDCYLPAGALLGVEGEGFKIAMKTLDGGRIGIAAQALGMAMRAHDDAFAFVQMRKMKGRTLWERESVQADFAWAQRQLKRAWQIVIKASEMRDRKTDYTKAAAQAKLIATETAWKTASKLTQYHGGMAVAEDTDYLQRLMDIYVTLIYEGANAVQTLVIERERAKRRKEKIGQ